MGRPTFRGILVALLVSAIVLWLVTMHVSYRDLLAAGSAEQARSRRTTVPEDSPQDNTAGQITSRGGAGSKAVALVPSGRNISLDLGRNNSSHSSVAAALGTTRDRCPAVLYTPTFITRIHEMYMIVDCWHHRVIATSGPLDTPIPEWFDVDADSSHLHKPLKIPHSVATDGNILVTESSVGGSDGAGHSLLVYLITAVTPSLQYTFHQEVMACDVAGARRPHRVIYDGGSQAFYLYLTSPPFLSKFVWDQTKQQLERVYCQSLPFMKGMYARSIVVQNRSLYITAGPGVIWQTDIGEHRVTPRGRGYSIKPIGFTKGKMNDLAWIDGWWYATSTVPCAMVRFRSLNAMHQHQKIHGALGLCRGFSRSTERCLGGTPYFVTKIGTRIFVPYIFGCSGLVSFEVDPSTQEVRDVVQHWGGGWVENSKNLACRGSEW